MKKSKKGMELEMLGWIILGLAALVIMVIIIGILTGKGNNALDFIKNLFRMNG